MRDCEFSGTRGTLATSVENLALDFEEHPMPSPVPGYRAARWLYLRKVPLLPHIIQGLNHLVFRCYIPYKAAIGENFKVGYSGFGIVVHQGAKIGKDVFLAHEVTLGGRGGPDRQGVPTIEDGAYVAAGAKILGAIVVGSGALVAPNAVVIGSVPARCIVAGVPARIARENINVKDYT